MEDKVFRIIITLACHLIAAGLYLVTCVNIIGKSGVSHRDVVPILIATSLILYKNNIRQLLQRNKNNKKVYEDKASMRDIGKDENISGVE